MQHVMRWVRHLLVVTILAARNYQVNVLEMCVALGGAAAVR
jgi:hypothetical protein